MSRAPRSRVACAAALSLAGMLAGMLAGCAPLPAGPVSANPPPAAVAPPASAPAAGHTGALPDTTPSPAALAVLSTIAEPVPSTSAAAGLAAAGAPASAPAAGGTPADAGPPASNPTAASPPPAAAPVAADTLRSPAAPSDSSSIPVPAPTTPLGQGEALPAPDTTHAAPPPPPPSRAAEPAPAHPVAGAAPDTCWRIQVGAPTEPGQAKVLRDGAQSVLLVPMVVEHEAGRYKVRSRDCLARAAASAVRDRAIASGFRGVFLVRVVKGRR